MIDGNPYIVRVKKWRKRNRIVAVTDNPIEVIDKVTGEVRTATPFVGSRKYKDVTEFVKWYEPEVLLKMKPYEVRVFVYIVSAMQFGGFVRFDYGDCMSMTGLSRSTCYRGLTGLVAMDVLRMKVKKEYWVNPNVVYRGQRDEFEIQDETRTEHT